jgi:LysR family transcriptional regulator, nitrogen assimilation regulatory protein
MAVRGRVPPPATGAFVTKPAEARMIDVQQLECFCAVVRSGSFSKAAAAISMAQPSLSRQIRKLEEQLGSKLLYRNGRGVQLTPTGSRFHESISSLIIQLKEAYSAAAQDSEAPAGRVSLGLPTSLAGLVGAPMVRLLKERYPGVDLNLIDGFSGHIHEWLVSGRIDIAVLHDARHAPTIAVEPLFSEDLYLVGRGHVPGGALKDGEPVIDLSKLTNLPLIVPGPDHGLRREIDRACAQAGVQIKIELDIDSLTAIKAFVSEGDVYSILPIGCVYQEVRAQSLRVWRIANPSILNKFVLAAAQNRPYTAAMRAVRQALRDQVALVSAQTKDTLVGANSRVATVTPISSAKRRQASA